MSQSNADKLRALGIPIPLNKTAGHHKVRCPRCASAAKHKNKTDLSVDIDTGQWRCHNTPECDYKGFVGGDITRREKVYVKPTPRSNITPLHNDLVQWFANRCISQQTLIDRGVMDGPEYMHGNKLAQPGTYHTMQFPYLDQHGELVNIKYRSAFKQFKFVTNAKLIMSNLNNIVTQKWCIVVEGEIDELTYWEAGYKMHVTSVPNGASSSTNANLEYLDNCWDVFDKMDRIILSTDDDEPGRALRAELIRRFGADRCFTVTYGEGCKDINEHVMKYGILSVESVIGSAVACPIKGVYSAKDLHAQLMDYYTNGLPTGDKIGIRDTDNNVDLLSFLPGQLTVITGSPNSGKSDYLDQIIVKLAIMHGWKFLIFSPENYPTSLHLAKLIEKITGKHFAAVHSNIGRITIQDIEECLEFIYNHCHFIIPEEDDLTLEDILTTAKSMVRRHGIKGLIIDPWNTLEHQRPPGLNETEYIGKALGQIVNFDRRHMVHTFLVAHPSKPDSNKSKKEKEIVRLSDISGSAHFWNKADNGLSLNRNYTDWTTKLVVQKVKYKHQGQVGSVVYTYSTLNGRFVPLHHTDTANWLKNKEAIASQPALAFTESIIEGNNDEPHPLD